MIYYIIRFKIKNHLSDKVWHHWGLHNDSFLMMEAEYKVW